MMKLVCVKYWRQAEVHEAVHETRRRTFPLGCGSVARSCISSVKARWRGDSSDAVLPMLVLAHTAVLLSVAMTMLKMLTMLTLTVVVARVLDSALTTKRLVRDTLTTKSRHRPLDHALF